MVMDRSKDRICVALDVDDAGEAASLARRLSPWVGVFKIGSQLFTSEGPKVVEQVREAGARVFLDLKYHDIPNTVAHAVRVATRLGVFLLDVHALGGSQMMHAAAEAAADEAAKQSITRPSLLAITVLTSFSQEALRRDLLVGEPMGDYVRHLARTAQAAGIDGVVASPNEIRLIRGACGGDFIVLTPGIRPQWSSRDDDQARVTTPGEALALGADFIVVGRPVIAAASPEKAAERLLAEVVA